MTALGRAPRVLEPDSTSLPGDRDETGSGKKWRLCAQGPWQGGERDLGLPPTPKPREKGVGD